MKLLLTSGGISNQSIADALFSLVDKKAEDASLVFIPTASNAEGGDKSWLIKDLVKLKELNFRVIDIVDISALGREEWLPRIEQADVLFFEGGNTFHLMKWLNKSGLAELLPEMLKTKVYVGVSAGSMVTNKNLSAKFSHLYDEDLEKTESVSGMGFVDFMFVPHLNSSYFTKLNEANIREAVGGASEKIYALDDNSALKVVDGKIEVVTEGDWVEIN